jgi:hypothetical protein
MLSDPTVAFTTFCAEHELRERRAHRAGRAAAAVRAGRGRAARSPLRARTGAALACLGRRLRGTAPVAAAGEPGRVGG